MTDQQLLTLGIAIVLPLSMLLYSNGRISEAKETLRAEMLAFRAEMRAEMAALHAEMRAGFDRIETLLKIPDDILWRQSGISPSGEPFVQLLRGNAVFCQMDPEQARDHARSVLEAAEAAEQDAFIFDWLQQGGLRARAGRWPARGLSPVSRGAYRQEPGADHPARLADAA